MTRTATEGSSGPRVWFITGASRGFGLEIAHQVLARGDALVATARDPRRVEKSLAPSGERLLAIALDVTDDTQAQAAVARFGRIDVLVIGYARLQRAHGVRPMTEVFPLARAAEASDRMMSGDARFRVVLTPGGV